MQHGRTLFHELVTVALSWKTHTGERYDILTACRGTQLTTTSTTSTTSTSCVQQHYGLRYRTRPKAIFFHMFKPPWV